MISIDCRPSLSTPSTLRGCPFDWIERHAEKLKEFGFFPPSHGSVKLRL